MNTLFNQPTDPFAVSEQTNPVVHLRIQKRTTRKAFTLVEGLPQELCSKLVKPLRKQLCTSASLTEDGVLKLQGDHRTEIASILISQGYTTADKIHLHGN